MYSADSTTRIGIVGSGPTAIYTLKELLRSQGSLDVMMFERTGIAGTGSPYRKGTNEAELLANIASVELPVVTGSLEDWLRSRTAAALDEIGVDASLIDDREFFPRVAIGAYFRDQLSQLIQAASAQGSSVEVRVNHDVLDIRPRTEGGAVLAGKVDGSSHFEEAFDHVVIATGHDLDDGADTVDPDITFFDSPYPSGRLRSIRPCRVGILGTSLSGIDAAVTVATYHGSFEETAGAISFQRSTLAEGLQITMMSRNGVLPEADFYCPIPYEPLSKFTEDNVQQLIDQGQKDLLDRTMELFSQQLTEADPGFADRVNLSSLDADTFPETYFRPREAADPFEWAQRNLDEVREDRGARRTNPWKYAILRMHEPFEAIVRHLDKGDHERFAKGMKKVFVDNYAAIPPLSIARLLALNSQGLLKIRCLGEGYQMERDGAGHLVRTASGGLKFDVVIDATGQRQAERELPFPTLRPHWEQAAKEASEEGDVSAPTVPGVYMAALPYMLKARPFVQGLPSCNEIGTKVASLIMEAIRQEGGIRKQPDDRPLANCAGRNQ